MNICENPHNQRHQRSIFAYMKKALIQLHIAVFLAGFTAILGKLITLNEGLLVWFRLFITVITLGAILYFRDQLLRIPFRDVLKIFGVHLQGPQGGRIEAKRPPVCGRRCLCPVENS